MGRTTTIKSLRAEDGHVLISVSDTGVGLPPQQTDHMFNAFFGYQAAWQRNGTSDQPLCH